MSLPLKNTPIRLRLADQEFKAYLNQSATAQSLIEQMPFAADMEDFAGKEKIFYPKRALSTKGAPGGTDALKGDITYYAPWGDVAIFYQDFGYAKGLVPLGKIEDIDGFASALKTASKVEFSLA